MNKLLCIAFIVIALPSTSQFNARFKKLYELADTYIFYENYNEAIPILLKLDSMVPNNSNIQFLLGLSYYFVDENKNRAIEYLNRAAQNVSADYYGDFKEKTASVFTFYFLGKSYLRKDSFDRAIEYLNRFKYYLTVEDKEWIKETDYLIQTALNAKKIMKYPLKIRRTLIRDLNTAYPEYAPVMAPDLSYIIFTSRRPETTGGRKDEKGMFFEDIYIADFDPKSFKASNVRSLPGSVNTPNHEASISISWDGKYLFIYKSDKGDGNIYMSTWADGKWSAPEKLAQEINSKYYENHACLSPDGQTLYFVSNRPGGYGGKDIWISKRLGHNKWSKPVNAGPSLNTEYDEDSPFILADGKTIYFSSKGHETMGGYDIFYVTYDDKSGQWSKPINVGYPINTTGDDVFFFPTQDGKLAFYATNQPDGKGSWDIYAIEQLEEMKNMVTLHGKIMDTINNKPIPTYLRAYNAQTGELVAQTYSDKETGEYAMNLPVGKKYKLELTTDFGLRIEDEFEIPSDVYDSLSFQRPYFLGNIFVQVKPDTIIDRINVGERIGDRFVLRNIYFDYDKATLRPESKNELDRLVSLLKTMPSIKIEVSGHTDNRGSEEYNLKLSYERAKAVVDYLIAAGVESQRLSYKGYGFYQPIATNETEEGRQLNRRVEFKVVGFLPGQQDVVQNVSNSDVLLPRKPKWHIIGGSFVFLKNAEKYRDEVIAKGFKNAEIIGLSSTGTFRVSLISFDNKAEAIQEINKLKKVLNDSHLWILEK
ncbi:MAG: OmpA family protein [Bacteroidales bacterium]|nr:OmpA family protein [Bacteroidales bacterium]